MTLLDQIARLLDARGVVFTRHPALPLLMMRFTVPTGQWGTFVEVQDRRFAIYSARVDKVAPGARLAVAELVTRANHGLYLGNFELDLDDGAVRFKTSVELADTALTPALFERVLQTNLDEMARHLPAIDRVAGGTSSVAEAMAQVARAT